MEDLVFTDWNALKAELDARILRGHEIQSADNPKLRQFGFVDLTDNKYLAISASHVSSTTMPEIQQMRQDTTATYVELDSDLTPQDLESLWAGGLVKDIEHYANKMLLDVESEDSDLPTSEQIQNRVDAVNAGLAAQNLPPLESFGSAPNQYQVEFEVEHTIKVKHKIQVRMDSYKVYVRSDVGRILTQMPPRPRSVRWDEVVDPSVVTDWVGETTQEFIGAPVVKTY